MKWIYMMFMMLKIYSQKQEIMFYTHKINA